MVLTSVSASAKQRVPMQGSSLTSQFIITIINDLMSSDKLGMLPELHSRIAVLRNLLYVDNQDLVTLKGRCCCLVGEGRKFYCSYGQEMLCC